MTEPAHDPRDHGDEDQDAEPASAPSGAAAHSTAAETEDQDAGPASEPLER